MPLVSSDHDGTPTAFFSANSLIDQAFARQLAMYLNQAVIDGARQVVLSMTSLGGTVSDGIFLHNHIRALPVPVTIYATSNVDSIAVAVILGASERFASRYGSFTIHPTNAPTIAGGSSVVRPLLEAIDRDDGRIEAIYRERAKLPEDILTQRLAGNVHIAPEDAVKYGLVSAVREFTLPAGGTCCQV